MGERKRLGFFREIFWAETSFPHMERCERPHPEEEKIVGYLMGGQPTSATPVSLVDAFDETKRAGVLSMMTDEVWEWPSVLAYYVRNYHIRLPEEFMRYLRSSGVIS